MEPFDLRQWDGFEAAGGSMACPAVVDQVVIDSRRVGSPRALFVALSGGARDGHEFVSDAAAAGVRYAIVNHTWRRTNPPSGIHLLRVENPLTALQQIAAHYRQNMPATVVAITGSHGKTMLKDMLQAIIGSTKSVVASPESFNSQIGVSLSLLNIASSHDIAIIEAGISEVGEMDTLAKLIAPDHAIITNINGRHLATLNNLETIAAEKIKLATAVPEQGWVILPDAPLLRPHLGALRGRPIFWNRADAHLPLAAMTHSGMGASMGYKVSFPDNVEVSGELHFGYRYLLDLMNMALKAGWLLGLPSQTLSEQITRYVPESMRTELWRSPAGITLINTPYCADPQSIDLALPKLDEAPRYGRKLFVFGGMRGKPKEADLRRVGKAIRRSGVQGLYLYGDSNLTPLVQELTDSPTDIEHHATESDALEALKRKARFGDHVLIQGPYKHSLESLTDIFDDGVAHNQCLINLAAIQHNLSAIRKKLLPTTRVMVIVKALAYGTEDIRVGRFLASCGVDILGVSYVEEGIALKRAGVSQAVFALNVAPYEVRKAVKWDLEVGVQSAELIQTLADEAARQGKKVKVHLHVDTGMSRLGCRLEEVLGLARLIQRSPSLSFQSLMTHFACADNPQEDDFTRSQSNKFDRAIAQLQAEGISPPYFHAANSATMLRFPEMQYNMVRIGLALYGLHASPTTRSYMDLKPAISLTSRIVGINECRAGESVSYGRAYQVKRPTEQIAVLPIGYFDGLHRHYSGKGWVLIRGHKAPMVGNICMDYLMVDVTDVPEVRVGDSVLIFGEDEYGHSIQPEDLASCGGSIIHELMSCLGPRIQRIFVYD